VSWPDWKLLRKVGEAAGIDEVPQQPSIYLGAV
jgi:hypothetical protein